MKKVKLLISSLVLAGALMFSSLSVFAMTQGELQNYVESYKFSQISSENVKLVQVDTSWVAVTSEGVTYYVSPAGVQEAEAHLNRLQADINEREEVVSQIKGLNDLNLTPDLESASNSLKGFIPAINFIIGLMVTVITAGMTLFTASDVCYILFPMFRGKCDNAKIEKGKTFNLIDKIISDEAKHSVKAAETIQTGKNPLIIYFGKRVISHLVLAVVLVILLTGNITVITNIAVKAVVGIIELIQKMGA